MAEQFKDRPALEGAAHAIPVKAIRTAEGRYLCEFGPEVLLERTDDLERDIVIASQRFHQVLESWLREYPELGFWMHRKFSRKSKRRTTPAALKPIHTDDEI